MRRKLSVLAVMALMAAIVALNAGYAFATPQTHNPEYFTTPAATPYQNGCVATATAPTAEEPHTPPGSSAEGGEPGYVNNTQSHTPCGPGGGGGE